MTYAIAKVTKEQLEKCVEATGKKMNTYPKGNMGLTPNEVKATKEWRLDRACFENAKSHSRNFNQMFLRDYKKEYLAERKLRFA